MQPHDYTTTKARDLQPGDIVEYGIKWRDDADGWRTGTGEVVRIDQTLVYVRVTMEDAKYMELPDRVCLFVPSRLRKTA